MAESPDSPSDADALGQKARKYLAEAQNTTDTAARDELLRLCEQVLQEAALAACAGSELSQ